VKMNHNELKKSMANLLLHFFLDSRGRFPMGKGVNAGELVDYIRDWLNEHTDSPKKELSDDN